VAIVVLFAARELGFSAGHVGVLWMLSGIGSLAAAAATTGLNRRYGFGATMLGGMLGTGFAWLIVAAAFGSPLLASVIFAAGLFVLAFSGMLFFVNYLTLRQAVTPDPLLGRVTATMMCLTVTTAPLGALAGGWFAEFAGPRATIALAGCGAILTGLAIAWVSPLARLRELPGVPQARVAESVTEEMAN
jgi:hypothetical protein